MRWSTWNHSAFTLDSSVAALPPITPDGIEIAHAKIRANGGRTELIDDVENDLRLRIGKDGAKWSVLTVGADGDRSRVSLGSWPRVTIERARASAQTAKQQVRSGFGDEAPKQTVREFIDLYDRRKLRQLRRGHDAKRALERGLAGHLDREISEITRRDVGAAIDSVADRAPISANRTLAYVKAMFSWAEGRGYLESNPARAMSKPTREIGRDRVPELSELAEIYRAAGHMGYPYAHIVCLLMFLASRRNEVAHMRVSELDLEENGDLCWVVPAERSKNGRAMRIGLPRQAVAILKDALERRPDGSPWVFSTNAIVPVSGWSRAKKRLDELIAEGRREAGGDAAAMTPWRLHDLRRSFATLACDVLQIDAAVADRCLNHVGASTSSTISRVYGRNQMFEPRKAALQAWADLLEAGGATHADAPSAVGHPNTAKVDHQEPTLGMVRPLPLA
jgi:integrase